MISEENDLPYKSLLKKACAGDMEGIDFGRGSTGGAPQRAQTAREVDAGWALRSPNIRAATSRTKKMELRTEHVLVISRKSSKLIVKEIVREENVGRNSNTRRMGRICTPV